MPATIAAAWDLLSTTFTGSSDLSSFLHVLEMAFGSNVAYAVLIRTGQLQGKRLEDFCQARHSEVKAMYDLLTADNPAVMSGIQIDGNKARCDNHIAESRERIGKLARWFAFAALAVAILAVALVVISGIWPTITLPNLVIIFGTLILFAPVPVGLGWTYGIVRTGESFISKEYDSFFDVLEVFKQKPKDATLAAIEDVRGKLRQKKPGILKRLFLSSD
jgi:hypothetical protein